MKFSTSSLMFAKAICDVYPVTRMESFRALKLMDPYGKLSHPKTLLIGEFKGLKTLIIGEFSHPNFLRP